MCINPEYVYIAYMCINPEYVYIAYMCINPEYVYIAYMCIFCHDILAMGSTANEVQKHSCRGNKQTIARNDAVMKGWCCYNGTSIITITLLYCYQVMSWGRCYDAMMLCPRTCTTLLPQRNYRWWYGLLVRRRRRHRTAFYGFTSRRHFVGTQRAVQ